MKKCIFLLLAMFCFGFSNILSAQSLPFTQCPPVGLSQSCAILIVITDDGLTVFTDSTQGTYDGDDDTLVGIQNNSSKTISSIRLSGGSSPIFGFDGDGICSSSIVPEAPGCPFPGSTGYEGPNNSFDVFDAYTGIVQFTGGLASGSSTYFGLEGAIQTVCTPLTVGLIHQYSSPWGKMSYDHIPKTIGAKGCAITSAAMTINYAASQQGSSFSTDPEALNTWLNNNGGYNRNGGLFFPKIAVYAQANGVGLYYLAPVNGKDDFSVLNYLCSNDPVTLVVKNPKGRDHYVLATGQLGVQNATPASNFLINDPGYNNSTLAGYQNTYSGIRPFTNVPASPAALVMQAFSPVQLLITDPQGNRLGNNPVTNTNYAEAPNGGCVTEQIGDDESPNPAPDPENLSCEFSQPLVGKYQIQVIGTGNGPYTLDINSFDQSGTKSTQTYLGTAVTNKSSTYTVNFNSDPAIPKTSTSISISPSSNLKAGETATITVKVTALTGSAVPSGTVTLSSAQGSVTLNLDSAGEVQDKTMLKLPAGTYTVVATYNGSNSFSGSSSDPVSQTLK